MLPTQSLIKDKGVPIVVRRLVCQEGLARFTNHPRPSTISKILLNENQRIFIVPSRFHLKSPIQNSLFNPTPTYGFSIPTHPLLELYLDSPAFFHILTLSFCHSSQIFVILHSQKRYIIFVKTKSFGALFCLTMPSNSQNTTFCCTSASSITTRIKTYWQTSY